MKCFKSFLLLYFVFVCASATNYNIISLGAKPDGKTICTSIIQSAIDESSAKGEKVIIPAGDFVTGTLFLKENTTLVVEKGARLLGSTNLSDYPRVKTGFRFFGDTWVEQSLIVAHNVNNITIEGDGIIDGQGSAFKVTTKKKPDRYRNRPYLLWIAECNNVLVKNIELRSSAMWMQSYIRCNNLKIDGIKVFNHSNKNNDLMDIDGCKDVVITNVIGDADDDGITFKSTTDRISENITVSNCIISSHCNAIKFGTESTAGFRNVTISNCVIRESAAKEALTGVPQGICGIALELVDGGIMENINISNIVIDGPEVPFFVRLGNRARKHYAEAPEPAIGSIRNINLSNIVARGVSAVAPSITGIPGGKVNGISLTNSRFVCVGGVADDMKNTKIEELETLYPESTMFGLLPASGLYLRHVDNVFVDNITFEITKPDARAVVYCDDVQGFIGNVETFGAVNTTSIEVLKNSSIKQK